MIINKKLILALNIFKYKPDLGNLPFNSHSFVITLVIAAFHCCWESISNTLPFGQFAVTWKSFTLIVTLNLAMFSWLHRSAIPNPYLTPKIKSNNIFSLSPPTPISKDQRIAGFSSSFLLIADRTSQPVNNIFISYIKMFSSSNLYSYVPLFPKNKLMFPCSLWCFANVRLSPQTPGRPSKVDKCTVST